MGRQPLLSVEEGEMKVDLKIPAIALLALLCVGLQAQEQVPILTPQDIQAASWEFQNYYNPGLYLLKLTLHDAEILPDGNRGYVYSPDFEVGTTPYTGDSHKDSFIRLREDVCSSEAIVIAKAGPASTYLMGEDEGVKDQGIITAHTFMVSQVFYGSLSPGSSIAVIEFGGIVRNGSETLEVAIFGMKPFSKGKDYLLFLAKVPGHPSTAYFHFNPSHSQLVGNRIYAGERAGDNIIDPPYGTGESVEKFQSNLEKAFSAGKCKQSVT
jgi:hypothetical protein